MNRKGKVINKYLFNYCWVQTPVFRRCGGGGGPKEGVALRDLPCRWGSKRSQEGKTVTKLPLKGHVSQDKRNKSKRIRPNRRLNVCFVSVHMCSKQSLF